MVSFWGSPALVFCSLLCPTLISSLCANDSQNVFPQFLSYWFSKSIESTPVFGKHLERDGWFKLGYLSVFIVIHKWRQEEYLQSRWYWDIYRKMYDLYTDHSRQTFCFACSLSSTELSCVLWIFMLLCCGILNLLSAYEMTCLFL